MVRINAVFDKDMIEEIDRMGKENKKSRSALLREAAERFIDECHRQKDEAIRKKKMAQAITVQDRLRKKSKKWNGVSELRRWRDSRS
jgi:metal-responsive CopG/Arc/MetJ family transcriptional regulator